METIVQAEGIRKQFHRGEHVVEVLKGCSLEINSGEFIALRGPSGSGKSTLLNILGLADSEFSGSLTVDGIQIHGAAEKVLQLIRRSKIGYVFQNFNLLSTLSVVENVMLPLILLNVGAAEAESRARALLFRMGLSHRLTALPFTLSGGEAQRVAIARAVVHAPRVVLADEPTGNLDSVAGEQVLNLLEEVAQSGVAVVMATHSESAIARCSRVVGMKDGALERL
jgi:putative ABC transport system ATP-binding protein